MAINAGIWIDSEFAVVVYLDDPERKIAKIEAPLAVEKNAPSGGRAVASFTKNDFVAEDRLQRKSAARRKKMFGEAVGALNGVAQLIILGPGGAKNEFRRFLADKRGKLTVVEVQTSNRLTDRGLTAHVRKFFKTAESVSPAKRSTPRKKPSLRRAPSLRLKA